MDEKKKLKGYKGCGVKLTKYLNFADRWTLHESDSTYLKHYWKQSFCLANNINSNCIRKWQRVQQEHAGLLSSLRIALTSTCFWSNNSIYIWNKIVIKSIKRLSFFRYIDKSDNDLPYEAKASLISQVLSGRFTYTALNSFLQRIKSNMPIPEMLSPDGLTYELLGLNNDQRQAGLRQYDHSQLFSLVFLQRSCGYSHGDYEESKPYIEGEVDEIFK